MTDVLKYLKTVVIQGTIAVLFLIFSFILYPAKAQNHIRHFEHFQQHHGLSSTTIYNLYQDRRGFLWISTQYGLHRFDGYRFRVYLHQPKDSFSLSAHSTGPLYEDPWGYLWIGTWGGGISRMDPKTGRCNVYRHSPKNAGSLSDNRIHSFAVDKDWNLWIGTFAGGLSRLNLKVFYSETGNKANPVFETITVNSPDSLRISDNRVWSLAVDSSGKLWIGTDNGLCLRNPADGRIKIYQTDKKNPESISHNKIYALVCDQRGNMWIGTERGLNRWDAERNRFIRYEKTTSGKGLSDNRIRSLWADNEDRLWIGTFDGGLDVYHYVQNRWENYSHDRANAHSIADNFIRALYGDRSGNLWIAAGSEALDKLNLRKPFFHYQKDPDNPNTLRHNDVTCFLEDATGVWVGTYGGGMSHLNLTTGKWAHYETRPGVRGKLSDHRIRALWKDQEGEIWIGTNGGGLNKYDRTTGRFTAYVHEPGKAFSLSSNRISGIVAEDENILWIATEGGGLNRLDRRTGLFRQFHHDPEDSQSVSSNYVNFILKDHYEHQLWIGTDKGIDLLLLPQERFIRVREEPRDFSLSAGYPVKCLAQDRDGHIWIGTSGGGLKRLKRKSFIIEPIPPSNSLPGDVIYNLLYDGRRYLWMSTNQGLIRYDPDTHRYRLYDRSDGLIIKGFHEKSAYPMRHSGGEMFFGAINGFTRFDPARLQDNLLPPRIVLTDLTVMESHPFGNADVSTMDTLILDYTDRDFSFEFSALDFSNPLRNQYAYRLVGYDRDWIFSGTRRYIRYTNLDGGIYTLRVKGSNEDGIWNEEALNLYVTIRPPFWQQGWFQFLAITLFLGGIGLIYRFRIRRIELQKHKLSLLIEERTQELKQKNIELEQLNEKKNEFLGVAAHDLRNPLGAMINFLDILLQDMKQGRLNLKEAITDIELILASARHMVQLITELLDISAIESGKIRMDMQPGNLNDLMEICERIHRKTALQKGIQLRIEKNPDLPVLIFDRVRMMEVMDNLLSNAIKYTYPGGKVWLYAEVYAEEVVVHVRDTGQGLTEEDRKHIFRSFRKLSAVPTQGEPSTGFGLAIVKKIIELHSGRVWVESQPGKGSTFSFSIPRNNLTETIHDSS